MRDVAAELKSLRLAPAFFARARIWSSFNATSRH